LEFFNFLNFLGEMLKKFTTIVETINEVNVVYPNFTPALNEKSKILMQVEF